MKRFVCEDSFWELFPDAEIGIMVLDHVLPSYQIPEEKHNQAAALLAEGNRQAEKWLDNPQISKNAVVAVWREAYRKFKGKKGARSSVENLLKRVLNGNPVGSIVPSVDVTNYVSLKYALPIGVENIDALAGDICLKVTEGGDDFMPLGSDQPDPTVPGELAYIDDEGAVCRTFNWRDGQRTAVSDETPHCVVVMELVDPTRSADLHAALDELSGLVKDILGAEVVSLDYLTKDHPSTPLE